MNETLKEVKREIMVSINIFIMFRTSDIAMEIGDPPRYRFVVLYVRAITLVTNLE